MYYNNGDVYEGNWVDDVKNGNGTVGGVRFLGSFAWSDGSKYSGNWVNDKMTGHGKRRVRV